MKTSTVAIGAMAGGAILVYSGIKGYGVSAVLRNVIAGKDPTRMAQATAIDIPAASGGTGTTGASYAGGNSIVDAAMKYVGVPYLWAGHTTKGWDCSGFVNHVIGVDLGLPIPGSKHFTGNWHGPTALMWYGWTGCATIPRSAAMPGDLAVWPTHMGIITGENRMVNAHSTGHPTEVTTIDGIAPRGEPLRVRRLKVGSGGVTV